MSPRKRDEPKPAKPRRRAPDGRRPAEPAARTRPAKAVAAPAGGIGSDDVRLFPPVLVGIGASAGGIDALGRLLPSLAHEGLAYVVIQHLAPDQTERFQRTLAEHCRREVQLVQAGLAPKPGCVYLAPAHALVEISQGRFLLARRNDPPRPLLPIDYFFYSLANGSDGPGIGVLLSGMGSDGIAGLREIKSSGGIAIAQDPETAEYAALPQAAIEAGLADLVLAPEKIAVELPRLADRLALRSLRPRHAGDAGEGAEGDLSEIFERLRAHAGVDFSSYKPGTIGRRLQRRMVLNRVDSLERYTRLLRERPQEVKDLYQDLLINVTRFFRDPASFEALRETVFPKLLENRRHDDPLRIWVPGCSTGEEAYSVAITLLECLGERAASYQIQIFATDVSESAVGVARAALYPASVGEQIGPERLRRFFDATDGGYRLAKAVRDLCVFTRHDVTRDPPFSHIDLIMCRNLLIYLGGPLQKRVISVLHYGLKPDGFLVLGSAESVGPRGDLFRVVDKRQSIYGRKPGGRSLAPTFPRAYPAEDVAGRGLRMAPSPVDQAGGQADRVLLERFAPPAVIVDPHFNIVQTRGQTGHFLELAAGEANLNILRMARDGLVYGLRTALHEARQSGRTVRKEGLRVRFDGGQRETAVEVTPLGSGTADRRHYLVMFAEAPAARRAERVAATPPKGKGSAQLAELREELANTRSYLQSMIQDLEAANEELQSAHEEVLSSNEELQSTNEELDTAKDELQSTNEELHTLNEELQGRNEELARANGDLTNLLASLQMAVLMVDNDLRIRRFTPAAERTLNVIAADVGRPVGHIKPNIDCPDLEQLIRRAIDEVTTIEREVRGPDQRWLQLRIRAYKDVDNRIDGAVVTLFDIERVKSRESDATIARRLAEEVLRNVLQPLAMLGPDFRVRVLNPAFAEAVSIPPADAVGRRLDELWPASWDGAALVQLTGKRRRRGGWHLELPHLELPTDGTSRRLAARHLQIEGDEVILLSIIEE